MRVVSLRLRLLAAVIDAAVFVAGMAAVIGAGIAAAAVYNRVRGDKDAEHGEEDSGRDDDGEDEPDGAADALPSGVDCATRGSRQPPLHGALQGASAGLAIAGRNWRSPGFRLIGLRRVDADTGGVVTIRSALIGVLFDQAWQAAWRPLFRSRVKRHQTRLRALAPQLSLGRPSARTAVIHKHAREPERSSTGPTPSIRLAVADGWLPARLFRSWPSVSRRAKGERSATALRAPA